MIHSVKLNPYDMNWVVKYPVVIKKKKRLSQKGSLFNMIDNQH